MPAHSQQCHLVFLMAGSGLIYNMEIDFRLEQECQAKVIDLSNIDVGLMGFLLLNGNIVMNWLI